MGIIEDGRRGGREGRGGNYIAQQKHKQKAKKAIVSVGKSYTKDLLI